MHTYMHTHCPTKSKKSQVSVDHGQLALLLLRWQGNRTPFSIMDYKKPHLMLIIGFVMGVSVVLIASLAGSSSIGEFSVFKLPFAKNIQTNAFSGVQSADLTNMKVTIAKVSTRGTEATWVVRVIDKVTGQIIKVQGEITINQITKVKKFTFAGGEAFITTSTSLKVFPSSTGNALITIKINTANINKVTTFTVR